MDSSSEGSFAWTDASDDSTDSEIMTKTKSYVTQSGEESESGKNYKKKLQQSLLEAEPGEETPPARGRKRKADHSDPVDSKKIKLEPESDVEYGKKKKKKTPSIEDTSNYYEESFLDSKVKKEETVESPAGHKKKKEKKNCVSNKESNDEYEDSFLDSKVRDEQDFAAPSAVKVKKSKKKHVNNDDMATHNGVDDSLGSDMVVDDENEISTQTTLEDTDLTVSRTKKKKKKKSRHRSPSMEIENHEEVATDATIENHQLADNELLENSFSMSHLDSGKIDDKPSLVVNRHTSSIPEHKQSERQGEKRMSRMSERIQFEEDEECDVSSKSFNTSSKPMRREMPKLEAYVKSLPGLRRKHFPFSTVRVTPDDDVWVLQCPQGITAEDFRDKKWTLNSKCKIKLAGNTYEGNFQDYADIILSTSEGTFMRKISVNGCIRLHRKLPKVNVQDNVVVKNNRYDFIPLPTTKCRHPLLGLNYKKALKLPAATEARLRAAPAEPAEPEPLLTFKKKKKKRKRSEHATETQTHPLSPQAWDSEKAIEQNLFNF